MRDRTEWDKLERRFERIAERAILAAEAIKCPGSDFVRGLAIIRSAIHDRLEAATEEFSRPPRLVKEKEGGR